MRSSVTGILILLATTAISNAADMPAKAPPAISFAYPYAGSGPYFAVDVQVGVAQNKVDGTFAGGLVAGNLNAAGGKVGGTVGYSRGFGDKWVAVEGTISYQNITASSPGTPVSFQSRWSSSQVVKFGGFGQYLADILSITGAKFPTLPVPPVPANFRVGGTHPYVMAGVEEYGIQEKNGIGNDRAAVVAPLVGMGILNQLVGTSGKPTGSVLDIYTKIVFASKSTTVTFDGGPKFATTLNTGNQYWTGMKVSF